ncbi:MAG: right-handed parallel beta-helix repeat-containing protein [Verrucomicrobiales bacterium]|nr:right-handed parallel beta-helix repeat-containing protein [Verrucomicrobiales bacterium]
MTALGDSGAGSLRQAITLANNTPGRDHITFAIPEGGGVIPLESPLPEVTDAVLIDGYSQPGAQPNASLVAFDAGVPVEVNGAALPPGSDGLVLLASDSEVVGLAVTGFRPSADGAGGAALVIDAAFGCVVRGCSLGVDRTGNPDGNGLGVRLRGGARHRVGGVLPADRNLVSANALAGILIRPGGASVERNEILGNLCGTDRTGLAPLPNEGHGIWVAGSSGNRLGGVTPGEPNHLAFNQGHGVFIASGEQNSVRGNRIHDNSGLGIELGEGDFAGPDPPDDLDADTGANGHLNAPLIRAAVIEAGGLRVDGIVRSRPDSRQTVEVFTNDACDASGYGEGADFVLRFDVLTDAAGEAVFEWLLPGSYHDLLRVTATATDDQGNTSEFAVCTSVALGLEAYADLGIEAAPESNPVAVGEAGDLWIRVEDRSVPMNPDGGALPSTLSVRLPPGLDLASVPEGSEVSGRLITWRNVSVPAAGVWETTIGLLADAPGTHPVEVAIKDSGPRRSNDRLTVAFEALPADRPVLRIRDTRLVEGGVSRWLAPVIVELSGPAAERVTFDYRTRAGTALPGVDYEAAHGVAGMLPGETTATLHLQILGDLEAEATEYFDLELSNVSGAFVGNGTARVTLEDDDAPVTLVADLGLTITATPEALTVASNVVFALVVTNAGPDPVVSARLISALSEGLRLLSAAGGQGVVTNTTGVEFDLGGIDPGQEVHCELVAETLRLGGVTNRASVALAAPPVGLPLVEQIDPQPDNDLAVYATDVLPAVGPPVQTLAGPFFNPQTGLQEQTVRFVNLDFTAWPAVRLVIDGLPETAVLYNASGIVDQRPFVQYDHPIAPGGSVVFVLEYYQADRQPIGEPEIMAQPVDPSDPRDPGGTPVPTSPERGPTILQTALNEGRFLIEFRAEPGERYVIQFRGDLGIPWRTAVPLIQASGNVVQWFDDGPPKTPAPPGETASRLYRVLKLDAPRSEIQP